MGIKDLLEDGHSKVEAPPAQLIINDRKFLTQKCEPATIVEAKEIWPILKATVRKYGGYGIAANQIGILKNVVYIEFQGKSYELLNPRVISVGDERILIEGESCLSFPKKSKNTLRFSKIVVEDDNYGTINTDIKDDGLFPVVLQHEIDHLNGRTIFDAVQKPKKILKTPSRNAPCPCGSGKKYKKCCLRT